MMGTDHPDLESILNYEGREMDNGGYMGPVGRGRGREGRREGRREGGRNWWENTVVLVTGPGYVY